MTRAEDSTKTVIQELWYIIVVIRHSTRLRQSYLRDSIPIIILNYSLKLPIFYIVQLQKAY